MGVGGASLSSARRIEAPASSIRSRRFQRGAVRTPRPTAVLRPSVTGPRACCPNASTARAGAGGGEVGRRLAAWSLTRKRWGTARLRRGPRGRTTPFGPPPPAALEPMLARRPAKTPFPQPLDGAVLMMARAAAWPGPADQGRVQVGRRDGRVVDGHAAPASPSRRDLKLWPRGWDRSRSPSVQSDFWESALGNRPQDAPFYWFAAFGVGVIGTHTLAFAAERP